MNPAHIISIVLLWSMRSTDAYAGIPIHSKRQAHDVSSALLLSKRNQEAKSPPIPTDADGIDRRQFLVKSLAASSIAAITLNGPSSQVLAAPDVATATSATTPSVAEGELTISKPPPNRAKIIIDTSRDTSSDISTGSVKNKRISNTDPRFFLAGGASAAFSHGITTPVDVVKTKQQPEPELYNVGIQQAALSIVEKEGPGELLVGLGPTVVGYGIEGALKFGVYESLKPTFLALFGGNVDPAEPYLAAAVCAGALASIILCPMEETRIRLVTDANFGKGLLDGLPRLIREEGFFSPFGGLSAMLLKQVPYTMAKQVSFDVFAAMLYGILIGYAWLPHSELAFGVEVGAAFLASIIACIASHPGDVLLTETYKGDKDHTSGLGTTISKVYSDGGLQAFFRGISARFVHVGCIITFQLVIYDQIKQGLGLPASGLPGTH